MLEEGPFHRGVQSFVSELNRLYKAQPAFWESDYDEEGFYWLDCSDSLHSVLSFVRQTRDAKNRFLIVLHLTPELRTNYRIGLPAAGRWTEVLNSDSANYGGSNSGNMGGKVAEPRESHGHAYSAEFALPPMSVSVFQWAPEE
jgi:1,4-alpha-glucan branching enzyme